jgi:signal peptidase I
MDQPRRQPRNPGWRFALLAVVLAVAISAVVRSLWVDIYYIPSASMEPLLLTGDRILWHGPASGPDP